MPDFTRFGASQRKQLIGQVLGLPTTMSFISIVSIIVTSGSVVIYGKALWDPVELASNFSNPVVVILGLVVAVLATVSANVAANVVSPSYDFSNAMPKWVNFRTGGMLTGVIGILIQPWRLLADPHIYIFGWLGLYGGVLAAVAGVLVAGYWVRDKTVLALPELYRRDGRYWFFHGWNLNAIIATVIGAVLAVGGVYSNPGQGPFPAGGLIPFLKPLYDYSWAVGLIVAFLVYLLLSMSRLSQQRPVPAVAAVDS
jgi:NCS1 family nucleobase:cation symporter-1